MDEGFMFILGVCLGALLMLAAVIRVIIRIHERMGLDLRRR